MTQNVAPFQSGSIPGGNPYSGLYGEALRERGRIFTLEVCERVGISRLRYLKGYVYLLLSPFKELERKTNEGNYKMYSKPCVICCKRFHIPNMGRLENY